MLKRVSIQNFKSLKDVTLDLQKVNLLIGPNNSGKTNFLKALEFCYDANDFKEIEIEYEPEEEDDLGKMTSVVHTVKDNFDHLEISFKRDNQSEISFHLSFDEDIEVFIEWMAESSRIHYVGKNNILTTEKAITALKSKLGEIIIYKPDPNRFIQPADFSADEISLNASCSNLISFLFYLNTNYKRIYQRIEKDLAICVKDIISFSSPPVKVGKESKLGLKFFGRNDESYWAEDISEGVLYFLALLTIINQPNPPKLLLLEEPEKGIHPRRIYEIIQFILGLIDDKDIQVIITTHSPTVVDMFKDMPESVFIFDKDDEGATQVKNLQKDIIEPETSESEKTGFDPPRYLNGLGEAWTVGFLGGVPR